MTVLFLLLTILLSAPRADADAIIVTRAMTATTIAEFFVEKSSIRVELEIGVADLGAFRNVLPDELYEKLGHEPRPLAERFSEFVATDLAIRTGDGNPLPVLLRTIKPRRRLPRDEISGEPLPVPEGEGEYVVFVALEYPFQEKPERLILSAPRTEAGAPAATVGFVLYHLGIPVNDFRYLVDGATVDLDWEDPWYSRFDNRNLRRQYDMPINTFLYVEPYEVRSEIIIRPYDLQRWIDLGLEGKETIAVDVQADLKEKAAQFLAKHNRITIDGEPTEMILDRIHFLRRTLRTSTVIDPPEELDIYSATLGVIFVKPTSGLPQEVTLTWDLFSPKLERVRAAATDQAGPLPYILMPDDNVLRWENFLKNPVIPTLVDIALPPSWYVRLFPMIGLLSFGTLLVLLVSQVVGWRRGLRVSRPALVAAGLLVVVGGTTSYVGRAASVSDERAAPVIAALLQNLYRAFDFREEEVVYDTLARSVSGDLLTQAYLETRRGLELASQGGARVRVTTVELLDVKAAPLDGRLGFAARSKWNVSGSVGHWGHVHQRTNQYEADLTVESVDGAWKITRLDLLQEERI